MNRRLLMGAAMIGSAATLVTAASFASFNDTESVGPKTLNAGTLDLQRNWSTPIIWSDRNLKPGDVSTYAFELENAGSLPGDLKMKIVDIKDAENGINEVETKAGDTSADGELSKYVTIKVVELGGRWGTEPVRTIYAGNLRGGLDKVSDATGLRARENRHYAVTLTFEKPEMKDAFAIQAQNEAQGDTVSFDLKFALVQANA